MKLELKHLIPYLPYKLECKLLNFKCDYVGEPYGYANGYYFINEELYVTFKDRSTAGKSVSNFQPILRPLSDLTKQIDVDGNRFVPIYRIIKQFSTEYHFRDSGMLMSLESLDDTILMFINNEIAPECHIGIFRVLSKWHFDVFGLIQRGLAIDINTIEE